jgi:hypothetical protein
VRAPGELRSWSVKAIAPGHKCAETLAFRLARGSIVRRKNTAERSQPHPVGTAMGWSMSTQCERPWPAIDLAELRYCLAFGSSVEEMADFLHRDVEDVRHKIVVEAQRAASLRSH